MRLAKLCITLAFAAGGWHGALANALCAQRADCHASAAPRAPHSHSQIAGRKIKNDASADAPDRHGRGATREAVAPANNHGHCGSQVESQRSVAHTSPHDAGAETARGNDENVLPDGDDVNAAPKSVSDLRAPASSCAHCVGQQTSQPVSVNSVAPTSARDSHATHAPARRLFTPAQTFARPRFAPTEHSPPRGRPLHLLNSALLI